MLGQALGLTDAEFEALQDDDYGASALFTEREKAVLAWAEAGTDTDAGGYRSEFAGLVRQAQALLR